MTEIDRMDSTLAGELVCRANRHTRTERTVERKRMVTLAVELVRRTNRHTKTKRTDALVQSQRFATAAVGRITEGPKRIKLKSFWENNLIKNYF